MIAKTLIASCREAFVRSADPKTATAVSVGSLSAGSERPPTATGAAPCAASVRWRALRGSTQARPPSPLVAPKPSTRGIGLRSAQRAQQTVSPLSAPLLGLVRPSQDVPVTRFRVAGIDAEFVLPVAAGCVSDALRRYADMLITSNAFPGQEHILRSLCDNAVTCASPDVPAKPLVGIPISTPSKLADAKLEPILATVRQAGCLPVLFLPMTDVLLAQEPVARARGIATLAGLVDGFIGLGGADVDPAMYAQPNTHSRNTNLRRDLFDGDLHLSAFLQQKAYLFEICRSHQLLNVVLGGTLFQDVQALGRTHVSQRQSDFGISGDQPFVVRKEDGEVDFQNLVVLAPESQAAAVLDGAASILTNSYHHQAVNKPGNGLEVVGTVHDDVTNKDTIEITEAWNAITCQFHPEYMQSDLRFRNLLQTACRRAHVFRHVKNETAAGRSVATASIQRWMRSGDAHVAFLQSDYDWVGHDLVTYLAHQRALLCQRGS